MNNKDFVDAIVRSAQRYPDATFSEKGRIHTCVNPYSYHLVRNNSDLYNDMDGLFVDGILMVKFIGWFWGHKIPRLSFDMTGMAPDLFNRLNQNDETIFFVGARQEEIEETVKQIRSNYPGMNIIGFRNGYFQTEEERHDTIQQILQTNPDFTIIGMGMALQENFALDLKKAGYQGIAFTCGGFLHQTSKGINYYPEWINKYNLRAFYRLYKERGLFKRLYYILLEFPILFTLDSLKTKLSKK
ncbi:MAG: WecB/TagA/CpsF family glycosyltransferase [Muribaculaceae bacterium]|nr:WecB/TagA/CpsF family glycosyltransferase [Muribaculaceae bacterium]